MTSSKPELSITSPNPTSATPSPVGTNVHHAPVRSAESLVAQYRLVPQVTADTSPRPRNSSPTCAPIA